MKLEIINLRKKIFQHLKHKALAYEGGHSLDLKAYQKDQNNYSKRQFKASNIEELIESVSKTNTSLRRAAKRWSSVMYFLGVNTVLISSEYGTGLLISLIKDIASFLPL